METASNDAKTLWKMYIWSGIKALSQLHGGDGVVILRTEKKNEYCFPVYREGVSVDTAALIDTLKKADDIRVSHLTMMWSNHWLDQPPYVLKQALTALTMDNADAKFMTIGEECFQIRSLKEI